MRLWLIEHDPASGAGEGDEGGRWVPRRRDARTYAARALAPGGALDEPGDAVTISRADVTKHLKGRALACALLNGDGWQVRGSLEVVETWARDGEKGDGKPRAFPKRKART